MQIFFILSLLCKAEDLVRLWKPSLAVCAGGMQLLRVTVQIPGHNTFLYATFFL